MTPGIYSAISALNARWSQQELSAQNISNVGTPGHKRQVTAFSAFLRNSLEADLPPSSTTLAASLPTSYDLRNGALQDTKQPLDVAINGDGFFQVQVADGVTRLTRSGHFRPDKNSLLVNDAGYPVLNDRGNTITLPSKGDVAIAPDGSIMVTLNGQTTPSGDKLGVVALDKKDKTKLASEGGLLFTSGDAKLNPVQDVKLLTTGHLESSNADVSREMVQMIQNQRMYDMLTRTLQMQDDGLGKAIQDLSGV